MTQIQIEELFKETIFKNRYIHNKVNGFSKDTIYNWRKGRTSPRIGEMLSVLYQLNLIKVEQNG
jgi:hypothetical protein